jgi:CrcB protein
MTARPWTVPAAVALGGMAGASARYGVSRLVTVPADGFPWVTLTVNVTGAFAIGLLVAVLTARRSQSLLLRALLGTGVLGGYTTFSTLSVEADVLVKDGRAGIAAAYVAVTLVAGLAAVALGAATGRRA